nr:hypothetical protein CFP56_22260 [Quercus suber]
MSHCRTARYMAKDCNPRDTHPKSPETSSPDLEDFLMVTRSVEGRRRQPICIPLSVSRSVSSFPFRVNRPPQVAFRIASRFSAVPNQAAVISRNRALVLSICHARAPQYACPRLLQEDNHIQARGFQLRIMIVGDMAWYVCLLLILLDAFGLFVARRTFLCIGKIYNSTIVKASR